MTRSQICCLFFLGFSTKLLRRTSSFSPYKSTLWRACTGLTVCYERGSKCEALLCLRMDWNSGRSSFLRHFTVSYEPDVRIWSFLALQYVDAILALEWSKCCLLSPLRLEESCNEFLFPLRRSLTANLFVLNECVLETFMKKSSYFLSRLKLIFI